MEIHTRRGGSILSEAQATRPNGYESPFIGVFGQPLYTGIINYLITDERMVEP